MLGIIYSGDLFSPFRYYSATIIKMSGVKSASAAIWLASVTAGTNFIFTFVGLFLVERIGRKSLTIGSLAGMEKSFLSMMYMTIRGGCRILESGVPTYRHMYNVHFASLCNFGVPEKV